ncbi:MAG: hypothetical protein LAP39_23655 [Acidobacteriia bacterium]|nr:hypothetical protein [Terriglobia bacterium]
MRHPIPPAQYPPETAGATPDRELDNLLANDPWLDSLEPFEIVWEMIWIM